MLRSCYEADVRFFEDSDQTIRIRWYFTNRPHLPVPTCYCSANWTAERGGWTDERGEVSNGKRPYYKGGPWAGMGVVGAAHFCGTPQQWLGACSIEDAHRADFLGRDVCCRPPPPLQALLGLHSSFAAGSLLDADLLAMTTLISDVNSAGLLPVALLSSAGWQVEPGGLTGFTSSLSGTGTLATVMTGVAVSSRVLSSVTGLLASTHVTYPLAPTLPTLSSLQCASGAEGVLAVLLAQLAVLQEASGELAGLLAVLPALGGLSFASAGTLHLLALLATVAELLPSLSSGGGLSVHLDLVAALQQLAQAQGLLLTTEQIIAALQEAGAAVGTPAPLAAGKATLNVSVAAFSVVTPSGGCGSLPASLVARFTGGSGSGTVFDGVSSTLTYSTGTQHWTGQVSSGTTLTNVSLACSGGTWQAGLSPAAAQGRTGVGTVTGTSGASPSLTGTITISSPSSGSTSVTITRT